MKTLLSKLTITAVLLLLTLSGCGDSQTASDNTSAVLAGQTVVVGVDTVYTVPKSGTLSVSQSFNGYYNGALGSLTIKNADGTDLTPPVCTGTAGQIKRCLKPYESRLALNPTGIEVLINGQTVVAAGSIPRTQGTAVIAVAINTTNTLQVNLTGAKGSYIQLTVTSENTPPVQNPIADFTYSPTSGTVPLVVSFDASASSSPNGSIVSYSWDFGDGGTGFDMVMSHEYSVSGTYSVVLTVTDSAGNSATKSVSIVAADPILPVAGFTYSIDTSTGALILNVDGSSSSSANGPIVAYYWDWGDGSPATTGVTASHTYLAPGTYSVTLFVNDNLNYSAATTQTITVP